MASSEEDEFERALEAVFEERASSFSPELRQMLGELWREGVLEGRALERTTPALELDQAQVSECGEWLCVPLPRELRVLAASSEGPARLKARWDRKKPLERTPFEQLLFEMDAAIIETLEQQARDAPLPGGLVVLARPPTPAPPKRRELANSFATFTSTFYGGPSIPTSQMWRKTYSGTWNNSPQTSTKDGSSSSGRGTSGGGSSNTP